MQIQTVSVRYGELRSDSYGSFSNASFACELSAELDFGETARVAIDRLRECCKLVVNEMFDRRADKIEARPEVQNIAEQILNMPR